MALASSRERLSPAAEGGRRSPLFWLGAAGLGAIWVAVAVISVFAPDSVSGTEQDHVPVAAIITWLWGLVASRTFLGVLFAHRGHPERVRDLRFLAGGVVLVWVGAAVVGGFGPEVVTGSDPTRIPVAAILAPIGAMVLTTTGCQLFSSFGPGGLR